MNFQTRCCGTFKCVHPGCENKVHYCWVLEEKLEELKLHALCREHYWDGEFDNEKT